MTQKIKNYSYVNEEELDIPNDDRYRKILEVLLNIAKDDYKFHTLEWRNRQSGLIKTYLWLAVTILAGQIHLFSSIQNKELSSFIWWNIEPTFLFFIFSFLALISSFFVFVLGIDTLRGRGGITPQFTETYTILAFYAYEEIYENKPLQLYRDLLYTLDIAIDNQKKQIGNNAKKLRYMSCTLLCSVVLSIISILPLHLLIP